jgi:hypothetical protein
MTTHWGGIEIEHFRSLPTILYSTFPLSSVRSEPPNLYGANVRWS